MMSGRESMFSRSEQSEETPALYSRRGSVQVTFNSFDTRELYSAGCRDPFIHPGWFN